MYHVPWVAMWAATFGRYFDGAFCAMSYYLDSKPVFDRLPFTSGDAPFSVTSESGHRSASEHAMDTALRNVPLPEGMMTRLAKLAHSLPDDSADQVDYLGC
jgi:hypothetical protein